LLRQLYYGAGRAIAAARGLEEPPSQLKQFLGHLFTIPDWIARWKLSGCRKGAMRVMALAKAHYPDIDPAKLAAGFPQFNLDNTEFDAKDLAAISKETRYAATLIAESLNLEKFQHGYDRKNHRVDTPEPVPTILIPPQLARAGSQKSAVAGTGTPAILPPNRPIVTDDDPKNQAFTLICWKTPALEIGGPQESIEAGQTSGEAPKAPEQPQETPAADDPATNTGS